MNEGQQEAAADVRLEIRAKLNEAFDLARQLSSGNAENTWEVVYQELDDTHDSYWRERDEPA